MASPREVPAVDEPENILWLNDALVASLLSPATAYQAVAAALECHARGEVEQPLKPYIRPRGREQEYAGGRFIAMPAFLGGPFQAAGVKWIAGFPANVARGLPRASGVVVLNSTDTGRVLAIMECATLSARRTAAVAALSFDHLAPPGPRRVAVIGAGPIGQAILEALSGGPAREIEDVRLCDLRPERAERVAGALRESDLPPVRVFTSAQAAVDGANVIIPATAGSTGGYLQAGWFGKGWLFIAISLDDCTPEVFLSADQVVVDDFDQCCREEKLLHRLVQLGRFSRAKVAATLGEVVAGIKPLSNRPGTTTYVNPMGMAVEDLAVALTVYRKAVGQGVGHILQPTAT
jgi:ornithine cyclodeaminase